MKRSIGLAVSLGAGAFLLASPMGAQGSEEEKSVTAQGACSAGSTWGLTMAPEVGVAFEVRLETGAPDQDWSVTLGYNKHVLLRTVETTEDDGGFEFTLVENNARGEDVGTVRMRNHVTAEVCWGRLRAEL